jgi:Chaperone of endosialidase
MTTTGNSGFGYTALQSNTTGNGNSAFGARTLQANTTGIQNVAVGNDALLSNTIGFANTAIGFTALNSNVSGTTNTAVGFAALHDNVTGGGNVAVGAGALGVNLADSNTAIGTSALAANTTGINNAAFGINALVSNVGGIQNVGLGNFALQNSISGNNNIAVGFNAGAALTTGSGNIYIGAAAAAAAEATTIRIGGAQTATFIAGIRGATTGVNNAIAVLIDSAGQLGTISSSIRFKDTVADMNADSSDILNLRPVTFVYKDDAAKTKQYGLIAEEVDAIFPEIVVKDNDGQPYTVQYHVLPVLLLNEMKKQQITIEELKKNTQQLTMIIQQLISRINILEKVSV